MKYHEFIGEVQNRLEKPDQAQAVKASRAFLTTLSERLFPGEAEDLAGALPEELDYYVLDAESGQRFSRDEFIQRVAEIEGVDKADAFRHIQVMMDILSEAVPEGELEDVTSELPEEFDDFFELVEEEVES